MVMKYADNIVKVRRLLHVASTSELESIVAYSFSLSTFCAFHISLFKHEFIFLVLNMHVIFAKVYWLIT